MKTCDIECVFDTFNRTILNNASQPLAPPLLLKIYFRKAKMVVDFLLVSSIVEQIPCRSEVV